MALLTVALNLAADERKYKFACLGDSITYGDCLGNREYECYPAVLQRLLGDSFDVGNFGLSVATASSMLPGRSYADAGKFKDAKAFNPDIVTIMLGTSDAFPEFWNDKHFCLGYKRIIEELKALPSNPRVILLTPIPARDDPKRDSTLRQSVLKDLEWLSVHTGVELLDMYWPLKDQVTHLADGLYPDACLDSLIARRIERALPLKNTQISEHPYFPPAQQEVRDNIATWQDYKFGMFIHWGIYSQRGIVESWSLSPGQNERCYQDRVARGEGFYEYMRNYEKMQYTFNQQRFDPSRWARAAREAGMKYMVFTTKHHDGFCMFDTQQTDYKVTSVLCPFHKDPRSNIALEVFNAFRAEGLATGAYFSTPDWHNEDYWFPAFPPRNSMMNYDTQQFPGKWERYNDYVNAQLEELTTGYGPLNLIWFDVATLPINTYAPMQWERFEKTIRTNQKGIMMVARSQRNIFENYRTPEQSIPDSAASQICCFKLEQ